MRFLFFAVFILALLVGSAAHASGGDEGPARRKMTSAESFVMVDPIVVSIVEKSRVRGMFVVEFGVDVADAELRARVEESLPRLRDVWVRTLNIFASTMVRPGRQADVVMLADRLQAATDQMLGATGARVLLSQAMVRKTS